MPETCPITIGGGQPGEANVRRCRVLLHEREELIALLPCGRAITLRRSLVGYSGWTDGRRARANVAHPYPRATIGYPNSDDTETGEFRLDPSDRLPQVILTDADGHPRYETFEWHPELGCYAQPSDDDPAEWLRILSIEGT